VPTAFSRSMRSLAVDGYSRALLGMLLATALLGGWTAWFLLTRVAVDEVTQTARLEVDQAVHPVETPISDPTSAIPLQHGLPGTVEVERVSPATLVLRAIGKRLGTLKSAFDARTGSEAAR